MMNEQYTEPDIQPEEKEDEPGVEIYSKLAIRAFSIFFSTIFGGVLLMINLRNVGYKKAAWQILAFSIAYTLIPGILAMTVGFNAVRSLGLIFNIVGGVILADYFFPKYFPENDYYPKPVWNALAVSIILTLGYLLMMYYSGGLAELTAAAKK